MIQSLLEMFSSSNNPFTRHLMNTKDHKRYSDAAAGDGMVKCSNTILAWYILSLVRRLFSLVDMSLMSLDR